MEQWCAPWPRRALTDQRLTTLCPRDKSASTPISVFPSRQRVESPHTLVDICAFCAVIASISRHAQNLGRRISFSSPLGNAHKWGPVQFAILKLTPISAGSIRHIQLATSRKLKNNVGTEAIDAIAMSSEAGAKRRSFSLGTWVNKTEVLVSYLTAIYLQASHTL